MKKTLFLLIGSALCATSLSAQITIDSTDITLPIQPQIAARYIVDTQVLNTNPVWDYKAGLNIIGNDTITFLASDNDTTFGTSTHMQNAGMSFGGVNIPNSTAYFNHTATGIYTKGIKISEFSLPLGNNDSIVFNTQNIVYPNNGTLMFPFPMDANTDIHDTFTTQINFGLYYAPLFNNAPGYVIRHTENVIHYNSDIKIALPYANDTLDALMVDVTAESVDSFYINNIAAPAMLLDLMGLTQGSVSHVTKSYVIGKGYAYPLAEVTFTDSSRNQVRDIKFLALHSPNHSVNKLDLSQVKVYPNPSSSIINIDISEAIFSKRILDLTGKVILKEYNDSNNINVNSLTAGNYLLEITTASGKIGYLKFNKQ